MSAKVLVTRSSSTIESPTARRVSLRRFTAQLSHALSLAGPVLSHLRAAGVAVAVAATGIDAQPVTTMTSPSPCAGCRIALNRVVTLSDSAFPIDDERIQTLRDQAGRFLITGDNGTSIGIYSAQGAFLRQVGRKGDQLGEFGFILAVLVGPGDSIHVFDGARNRRTIFDPMMTRAVRATPIPRMLDVALLDANRLVLSGSVQTRESAGLPLHMVEGDGRISRSFAVNGATMTSNFTQPWWFYRSIVPARGGGFWIAPATRYSLERWSSGLKHERTLQRSVDWFPPVPPTAKFGSPAVERPPTLLRGLWEEPNGLLFINFAVAATNWRPTQVADGEHSALPEREVAKYIDTKLEVLDPSSATVLATLQTPGIFYQVRNGPFFAIVRAAKDGVAVEIVRMEYVHP